MKTITQEVTRKVTTIFGSEIEKKANVLTPQVESLADAASVLASEDHIVAILNFALRLLGQRQANNDLKAASSGLNEADQTAVRQILRYVGQAKDMDEDPIECANKILSKPKFAHLRAVFEGETAGTVTLDYTGFEDVDGVKAPKLSAPRERERS